MGDESFELQQKLATSEFHSECVCTSCESHLRYRTTVVTIKLANLQNVAAESASIT